MMKSDILHWHNDDLPVVTKRSRVADKYSTLFNYMTLFSTGMKGKWGRVYIDLYAGSGCVQSDSTGKVFKGSALLALSVQHPFDSYIFSEENPNLLSALKARTTKHFSTSNCTFIQGDCNAVLNSVVSAIPKEINGKRVLVLCVVDPDALVLKFQTIQALASIARIDFIVLMALMMDANRWWKLYLEPSNTKIEDFLGVANWRPQWNVFRQKDDSPARFLTIEFESQMASIGYQVGTEITPKKEVRSIEKNLPLYHLAFFSKHARGIDLWKKGLKYSSDQTSMDFK